MPTFVELSTFGPRFAVKRDESVAHFLILRHFGGPHCRVICAHKYEKMSRMNVCVGIVLWFNVRVMNVKLRRLKEDPGADISILLSKSTKGAAIFNVLI